MMARKHHHQVHRHWLWDVRAASRWGVDTPGFAASLLTLLVGLACHGRRSEHVGENQLSCSQVESCSWGWSWSPLDGAVFWSKSPCHVSISTFKFYILIVLHTFYWSGAQQGCLPEELDYILSWLYFWKSGFHFTVTREFALNSECLNRLFSDCKVLWMIFKWGWVFLEPTQIPNRFQFTRHFIEFVVLETKHFVGSNVNVILWQTCGERSSMSTESKRRASGKFFPCEFGMCS